MKGDADLIDEWGLSVLSVRRALEAVQKSNRTLRGWANYFEVGAVTKAYRGIDNYTAVRCTSNVLLSQMQLTTARMT